MFRELVGNCEVPGCLCDSRSLPRNQRVDPGAALVCFILCNSPSPLIGSLSSLSVPTHSLCTYLDSSTSSCNECFFELHIIHHTPTVDRYNDDAKGRYRLPVNGCRKQKPGNKTVTVARPAPGYISITVDEVPISARLALRRFQS